ncbi:MAG: HNH endonuclease [Steroidobacteraceae bacterium]
MPNYCGSRLAKLELKEAERPKIDPEFEEATDGDEVRSVERACRITKVERMEHLIASHVRPWRDSNNEERLDGENGLLLTPTVDHLFDKGFISFEDSGQLIVSPVADPVSLKRMGIDRDARVNVGVFSQGQRRYLDFHSENALRMARGAVGFDRCG